MKIFPKPHFRAKHYKYQGAYAYLLSPGPLPPSEYRGEYALVDPNSIHKRSISVGSGGARGLRVHFGFSSFA